MASTLRNVASEVIPRAQAGVRARNPQFFIDNPDELIAMLQQKSKANLAGFEDDLRESLADAGLLQSGVLGSAMGRARIANSQQQLGGIYDIYQRELQQKRQFDVSRALQLIEQDHERRMLEQQQEFNLGQAFGGILNFGGQALGGWLGGLGGGGGGGGATRYPGYGWRPY